MTCLRLNMKSHSRRIARFGRSEDGSFVLFGLFLFVAMLIVGGVAVDILRQDYARVRMQNAVDNAVLAAADLDQSLDPKSVVTDYLTKAGVVSALDKINVASSPNSRVVSVEASVDVQTMFMPAVGVNDLTAAVTSAAREDIRDVEISLVLDISGSMGTAKLNRLKTAARSFVDKLLRAPDGTAVTGSISISIVPYSTQVNAGSDLLDAMTISHRHGYSHCVDFDEAEFATASLSGTTPYRQTARFDISSWANNAWDDAATTYNLEYVCRTDAASEVLLYEDDIATLKSKINSLWSRGNTSIEIGLKWGAGLLDPDMNEVYKTIGIDSAFEDRPYAYREADTMKILVVMTDGANTTSWSMAPEYSGEATSDMWEWWSGSDWEYSVLTDNGAASENARKNPNNTNGIVSSSQKAFEFYLPRRDEFTGSPAGGRNADRLTWQGYWSKVSVDWNAWYARSRQENDYATYQQWMDVVTEIGPSIKDTRMKTLCEKIKNEGITVFAVSFEIDSTDAQAMKDCASTDNHHFAVRGDQITYAFNSIATTINQLKLTQ